MVIYTKSFGFVASIDQKKKNRTVTGLKVALLKSSWCIISLIIRIKSHIIVKYFSNFLYLQKLLALWTKIIWTKIQIKYNCLLA